MIVFSIVGFIGNSLLNIYNKNSSGGLAMIIMIAAEGISGFLLGLFLRMRKKLIKMVIAGIVALPISVVMSFFLSFVSGISFNKPDYEFIINVRALIFGIIINGTVFGVIYDIRSILIFPFVCGIISIPSGLLFKAIYYGYLYKFWEIANTLIAFAAVGTGIGLSIGLYNLLILKGKGDV